MKKLGEPRRHRRLCGEVQGATASPRAPMVFVDESVAPTGRTSLSSEVVEDAEMTLGDGRLAGVWVP